MTHLIQKLEDRIKLYEAAPKGPWRWMNDDTLVEDHGRRRVVICGDQLARIQTCREDGLLYPQLASDPHAQLIAATKSQDCDFGQMARALKHCLPYVPEFVVDEVMRICGMEPPVREAKTSAVSISKIDNEEMRREFEEKIEKTDGCWIWTGSASTYHGLTYGQMRFNNRTALAHRVSWILHHGEIPPGIMICHKCDNPICVNPSHLFLGTAKDNAVDRETKRRGHNRANERNARAKLTREQVHEIRTKYKPFKYGSYRLANEYGVCHSTVLKIVKGDLWPSV